MTKDKKPNTKFNPYWIYGGLLILFIGLQLFSGDISNQD